MHQKVVLVDDDLCSVGTANLDNRSFRLNFEITLLYCSEAFTSEVEAMLERDFAAADPVPEDDYASKNALFRLGVSAARLWAPIL